MLAEFGLSETFRDCVNSPDHYQGTESFYQHGRVVAVFIFRSGLCSLRLIGAHNGFFSFIGTVAVAAFTFTLWRSTEKLWLADQQTRVDTLRSIVAAENSAIAAASQASLAHAEFLATNRPRLTVRRIELMLFREGQPVSFLFVIVNTGRAEAKSAMWRTDFVLIKAGSQISGLPKYRKKPGNTHEPMPSGDYVEATFYDDEHIQRDDVNAVLASTKVLFFSERQLA